MQILQGHWPRLRVDLPVWLRGRRHPHREGGCRMKTMRPYQIEAHDCVLREFEKFSSTLVVLPTGMGKTIVAAKVMTGWQRRNCLFIAHTSELIEQAAAQLAAEMDGYRPIVEMNVRGVDPDLIEQGGLIVIASVQTMFR